MITSSECKQYLCQCITANRGTTREIEGGGKGRGRVGEGKAEGERERESRKTAQDKELSIITGLERNQSREWRTREGGRD